MSDKQGQGERLYVIQDGDGDLWGKHYIAYITPITQGEYGDLARGDKLVAIYDPATERVVPKGAEVWTFEQLEDLLIRAEKDPENKLSVRELIAQARGKGE